MQAHGTSTESLSHISAEITRMQLRRLGSSLAPLPESPTSSGPPDSQSSDLPLLAVGRPCCLAGAGEPGLLHACSADSPLTAAAAECHAGLWRLSAVLLLAPDIGSACRLDPRASPARAEARLWHAPACSSAPLWPTMQQPPLLLPPQSWKPVHQVLSLHPHPQQLCQLASSVPAQYQAWSTSLMGTAAQPGPGAALLPALLSPARSAPQHPLNIQPREAPCAWTSPHPPQTAPLASRWLLRLWHQLQPQQGQAQPAGQTARSSSSSEAAMRRPTLLTASAQGPTLLPAAGAARLLRSPRPTPSTSPLHVSTSLTSELHGLSHMPAAFSCCMAVGRAGAARQACAQAAGTHCITPPRFWPSALPLSTLQALQAPWATAARLCTRRLSRGRTLSRSAPSQ